MRTAAVRGGARRSRPGSRAKRWCVSTTGGSSGIRRSTRGPLGCRQSWTRRWCPWHGRASAEWPACSLSAPDAPPRRSAASWLRTASSQVARQCLLPIRQHPHRSCAFHESRLDDPLGGRGRTNHGAGYRSAMTSGLRRLRGPPPRRSRRALHFRHGVTPPSQLGWTEAAHIMWCECRISRGRGDGRSPLNDSAAAG